MAVENEQSEARTHQASGPAASPQPSLPALQLSLPGFEGPIELLLRLTEREQFDITTVSLLEVTAQYLEHFRAQPWADAVALGDFVSMGARLLLLKSRSLLPRTQPLEDGEDAGVDEAELLRALGDYSRYREAAASFGERAAAPGRLYPRAAPAPVTGSPPPLQKVPLDQLILALQQALARFPEAEPTIELPPERVSVAERVEEIRGWLRRQPRVGFLSIVGRAQTRLEVVVSFIAVLHLIRDQEIEASQSEPFGEIWLSAASRDAGPDD